MVAEHPIELRDKRGEARAREMAYGSLGRPWVFAEAMNVEEGEGRILDTESMDRSRMVDANLEDLSVTNGSSTPDYTARRIFPDVRDLAQELGLDLAAIGRALGGRLEEFLRDHDEIEVGIRLRDYAKMTGAKPPKEEKESPQPSDADVDELFR